jgi:hypothetical protein
MGLRDEFDSWVILSGTHNVRGWVGLTAHLDALEKTLVPTRKEATVS